MAIRKGEYIIDGNPDPHDILRILGIEALADFLTASGEDRPDLVVEVLVDGRKQKEVRITAENLFGFDGGMVYLADRVNRVLTCEAFISSESLDISRPQEFKYSFDDVAFASTP